MRLLLLSLHTCRLDIVRMDELLERQAAIHIYCNFLAAAMAGIEALPRASCVDHHFRYVSASDIDTTMNTPNPSAAG